MPVFKKPDFHTLSKSNEYAAIYTATGDIEGGECSVFENARLAEVNVVFNIFTGVSSSAGKCYRPNSVINWLDKIYGGDLMKAIHMRDGCGQSTIHDVIDRLQWKYSGTVHATEYEIFG